MSKVYKVSFNVEMDSNDIGRLDAKCEYITEMLYYAFELMEFPAMDCVHSITHKIEKAEE